MRFVPPPVLVLVLFFPVLGQERKKEPLVDQVDKAIKKGIRYLRQEQRPDGSWEVNVTAAGMKGGWTCLAMLGLLNAGVPVEDPMIQKGLDYVRRLQTNMTYVRALQTMVLAEAAQGVDREKIKENVDWLLEARVFVKGEFIGWSYTRGPSGNADNSNTQFAMLGLLAGRQAGIAIPKDVWQEIRKFYMTTQLKDGGWAYSERASPHGTGSTMTMTTAGLCGVLIAALELNEGRLRLDREGKAENCGEYKENETVAKALHWLGVPARFRLEVERRTFYNLYGIERAGRLSGLRFLGGYDWYREGCKFLVEKQRPDGSWQLPGFYDSWPTVSTSFSLLFLSKGRTPVLISKLAHGPWPRKDTDIDWNRNRNAVRHLTEFVSRNLFKNLPLAWQVFDIQRAVNVQGAITDETLNEATAELLQAPILYINGHENVNLRLRDVEKEVIKRFVENGGFIIAEACCGSPGFDRGFRDLVAELWPNNDLAPLPKDHAIWSAHYAVPPGSWKLEALQVGCKTVLVYSPQPLSTLFEVNKHEDERFLEGRSVLAFRLGANVIAYATGMVPPKPRLSEVDIASTEDKSNIRRGFLAVAQLKHGGDWQPAPRAMTNLMSRLRRFAGVDVTLKTEEKTIGSATLIDYKLIYMHGRGNFMFNDQELKHLRFNLMTGGLLLADACCGKEAFDTSFRAFMKQLFPDGKYKLEPVPLNDELYSKDLNGEAITEKNIKCRRERGGPMRNTPPALEGVKVDGRWVVLYSKYDIGCALERHTAPDCLGYDHESALRLGTAAVLYLLRP